MSRNRIAPLFALAGASIVFVATARSGAGNDPIEGQYSGRACYRVQAFIDGIPGVFQQINLTDDVEFNFGAGGFAQISTNNGPAQLGEWKRKGQRYALDFSDVATENLRSDSGDSKAKATWRMKGVRHTGEGVSGKYLIKYEFRADLMRNRQIGKGVFGAAPAA